MAYRLSTGFIRRRGRRGPPNSDMMGIYLTRLLLYRVRPRGVHAARQPRAKVGGGKCASWLVSTCYLSRSTAKETHGSGLVFRINAAARTGASSIPRDRSATKKAFDDRISKCCTTSSAGGISSPWIYCTVIPSSFAENQA